MLVVHSAVARADKRRFAYDRGPGDSCVIDMSLEQSAKKTPCA